MPHDLQQHIRIISSWQKIQDVSRNSWYFVRPLSNHRTMLYMHVDTQQKTFNRFQLAATLTCWSIIPVILQPTNMVICGDISKDHLHLNLHAIARMWFEIPRVCLAVVLSTLPKPITQAPLPVSHRSLNMAPQAKSLHSGSSNCVHSFQWQLKR